MKAQQHDIDEAETRLSRQNGVKAALAVALWCVPVLILWYSIHQVNDRFSPVMFVVSGVIVGLAVRYHGRGYAPSFSLIAFLAHFAVAIAVFSFGMSLGEGQSVRGFILAGLYAAGAWAAMYLGRISIPFEYHRAFYVLTEQQPHPSNTRAKNRWFVVAPLTLLSCGTTLFITLIVLSGLTLFNEAENRYLSAQQQRDRFENQAIDVTSDNLAQLSNEEAMRHAFAFFNGYMPAKHFSRHSQYPQSAYKARRILAFLTEERNDSRAKFVLGLLTYNDNGMQLIQQAANEGDIFAKLHTAIEFGCYGDKARAIQLLTLLARTTGHKYVLQEIDSILAGGFGRACSSLTRPDFNSVYLN